MYEVDERDRVLPLQGIPQSSTGAPLPFVIADEHHIVLAYYMADQDRWDGVARSVSPTSGDNAVAIVRFVGSTHMFGSPNDEAFAGHPLAGRGLEPYGAFLIEDSSWIRKLERMNSVHPVHRPNKYRTLQHLVFAFHDSTFECVCEKFDLRTVKGSMRDAVPDMVKLLGWGKFKR